MITFDKIPDKLWAEGYNCKVWVKGDYVYKAYTKYSITKDTLQKHLDIFNSLPEYEHEEIVGTIPSKNMFVTRQRKLLDWQDILVSNYYNNGWREIDWEKIVNEFLANNGYMQYNGGWRKNGITLYGLRFHNFGMDENKKLKIIDASLQNRWGT